MTPATNHFERFHKPARREKFLGEKWHRNDAIDTLGQF